MTPERYSLADVDGILCIRFETSDYCNPSIVTHYWPTIVKTRDALRYYFDDADVANLAKMDCVRSRPGEYFIGVKDSYSKIWQRGQHVCLTDGGATQPIKTEVVDAKQPKTRKGTMLYWSNGCWVKHTSRGVERICPLSV